MRTRNAETTPKLGNAKKTTPQSRKSAIKNSPNPNPPQPAVSESATPTGTSTPTPAPTPIPTLKAAETKRVATTKAKQVAKPEQKTTAPVTPSAAESKPQDQEQYPTAPVTPSSAANSKTLKKGLMLFGNMWIGGVSHVFWFTVSFDLTVEESKEVNALLSATPVVTTPKTGSAVKAVASKTGSGVKVVKKIVKVKTPASKANSAKTPKSGEARKSKVVKPEKSEAELTKDEESVKKEEPVVDSVAQSAEEEQRPIAIVEEPPAVSVEEQLQEEIVPSKVDVVVEESKVVKVVEGGSIVEIKGEPEPGLGPKLEPVNLENDSKGEGEQIIETEDNRVGMDLDDIEEDPKVGVVGDNAMIVAAVPAKETEELEEERMEITTVANERKIKKELEIFVGGLDRDSTEEDVRKVFEHVGEVVEVRLNKNASTNKNKGYAFVRFATKEQASRALSEMKNPVIRGKRCGTSPNEDNDTLFLGNICNTWTKEAIKQKIKDYGVEGVENITLVADPQHEGLSRGFAFVEFSCHAEAMLAYKRLQQPDAIFGHAERTAKVAFAEPLREPDPEVMAQVKSVFVDGLPPHWDEDRVREQFKVYGEIERIMLARNMSTAKRKDFGFVDFNTHEAAIACIDGINKTELVDGNSKIKVKARLSNPLPKTQAVKGGMCGGYRIGHGSGGNFPRTGRGFAPGGAFGRGNLQRGRGFHQHGGGHAGRMGFFNEYDHDSVPADSHGRRMMGRGGRGAFRGAHQAFSGVAGPSRLYMDELYPDTMDRGPGGHFLPRRQPFSPEADLSRPFVGGHFDDYHPYDGSSHGTKRPFYMTEQDPGYMEPNSVRPRVDYSDPTLPFRRSRYLDTFGAGTGSDMYSRDYYNSQYGGNDYPPFYGGDRPYGGGYYY
ncbi:RNA recognition motif domain [Dillenia turbinata]|uniref:RNA recognition motif domain n=1 Tax=Dillenia turbinata TaxID=194707 RepID=A0AAN8Z6S2_9MAGN